jgi:hypothetical protein
LEFRIITEKFAGSASAIKHDQAEKCPDFFKGCFSEGDVE